LSSGFNTCTSQRRGQPLAAPQKVRSFETAEVLERIRNVIRETTTPTWLGSVPKNFGEASAGTIKADEWRSLITIYLPIALVSLWGAGTSHSSDELAVCLRIMLDHTMELVCAVYLACARTMSARRAQAYRSHIAAYVGKLQEIHPTFSLRPNHHASFHIYDYLLLFGPAHSWWCFPFERLIGIIQRIPINHKFGTSSSKHKRESRTYILLGELENTMLLSYIKAARLRCWLARPDCPPAIQECGVLFDRVFNKNATNSIHELAEDPMNDTIMVADCAATSAVPEDLYTLIRRRTAVLRATLKFEGVIYSKASTHVGNSQIFFYPRGDRSLTPVPANIKYIYSTLTGELLFAVQRHIPLDHHIVDPFSLYPDFPAKLYSTDLENRLENAKVSWVVSHFARWRVSDGYAVILSLSRD
jgi:hypothetical protein